MNLASQMLSVTPNLQVGKPGFLSTLFLEKNSTMSNQLSTIFALTLLFFLMSCHGGKKSVESVEEATVWVNSDYLEGASGEKCYAINFSEILKKDQMGIITSEWETACVKIEDFDYEQSFIYRLKVKKTGADEWKLLEVLSKEKDVHCRRKETKIAWIGPKIIQARCLSPMAPPDCMEPRHQVQFGKLDKDRAWEPMYDLYTVPDFEEGYIYKIRYIKAYLSEFESSMIADHHGWEIEEVEVLSKEKF